MGHFLRRMAVIVCRKCLIGVGLHSNLCIIFFMLTRRVLSILIHARNHPNKLKSLVQRKFDTVTCELEDLVCSTSFYSYISYLYATVLLFTTMNRSKSCCNQGTNTLTQISSVNGTYGYSAPQPSGLHPRALRHYIS